MDAYNEQIETFENLRQIAYQSKEQVKELRQEIYDDIAADPNLSGLTAPVATTTSFTGKWLEWLDIFAFLSWLQLFHWVRYKLILEDRALSAIPHTARWYRDLALRFQFGDSLVVFPNGSIGYDPIIPANQIVDFASVKETPNGLVIKVAKDVAGILAPLSTIEKSSLEGYFNAVQDAGVNLSVISDEADVLRYTANIYYDPISTTFQTDVIAAIENFLKNLPFDGILRLVSLEDAIQGISGFVDLERIEAVASPAYTTSASYTVITVNYEAISGYINIDSNFPLSTTLNFIPNV